MQEKLMFTASMASAAGLSLLVPEREFHTKARRCEWHLQKATQQGQKEQWHSATTAATDLVPRDSGLQGAELRSWWAHS